MVNVKETVGLGYMDNMGQLQGLALTCELKHIPSTSSPSSSFDLDS